MSKHNPCTPPGAVNCCPMHKAAPLLLEALKDLVSWQEPDHPGEAQAYRESLDKARLAISAATESK